MALQIRSRNENSKTSAKKRIGDILVEDGIISRQQLEIALQEQAKTPEKKLGEILVGKKFVSQQIIDSTLSNLANDLNLREIPSAMQEFAVLIGRTLHVLSGRQNQMVVQSWLAEARRDGVDIQLDLCDMQTLAQIKSGIADSDDMNLSAVRSVRRMVVLAAAEKASDIHLTLRENMNGSGYLQVQFRVQNEVEDRYQVPQTEGAQMIRAMFQGMAAVSDAQVKETEDQHAVIVNPSLLRGENGEDMGLTGLRLARAPLHDGMNLAIRLLYRLEKQSPDVDLLAALGYSPRQLRILHLLSRQTMGINPFTGPTGSGKSTTLAQMINTILRIRHGVRIITIEDPVEYVFQSDYVWQYKIANANTDEEKNRAFAGKLKTALRQDPDIIMVGEIRGLETAKEAVNASITGHQVWTTLHVSDPFMIAQRLVGMGVDGFYLQDPKMLSSLIAQRLVKLVCPYCAQPANPDVLLKSGLDKESWENLLTWESAIFPLSGIRMTGPGCGHCNHTGSLGRAVVAQVIPTDDDLLVAMVKDGPMPARKLYASRRDAEISMEAHGVLKILKGLTDPRFIVDVLGPIPPRPTELRELTEDDV
ncbi:MULTISPECIES: GspE/PulE family protein [Acidithiobacillus]|uniref:Secretion system protein E n=2 Tax=Acidithiobacillus TaxID=119977 RepID=A0A5P9XSW6_ACITH|nr:MULTISPECIES: ATPase, T2SS/T4P/T4SS family [Acidithiobacillus]QFX96664.1 secretion system protein E [Acidithiobacillus thiooxidans ATCC 19377]